MKGAFKSREECLREATEYDRLARLARLKSSRKRAGEIQSARIH
jgi:hypothetical protein